MQDPVAARRGKMRQHLSLLHTVAFNASDKRGGVARSLFAVSVVDEHIELGWLARRMLLRHPYGIIMHWHRYVARKTCTIPKRRPIPTFSIGAVFSYRSNRSSIFRSCAFCNRSFPTNWPLSNLISSSRLNVSSDGMLRAGGT